MQGACVRADEPFLSLVRRGQKPAGSVFCSDNLRAAISHDVKIELTASYNLYPPVCTPHTLRLLPLSQSASARILLYSRGKWIPPGFVEAL